MTKLNLVNVETPTHTYLKARARIEGSTVTITNQRGVVLATFEDVEVVAGDRTWSFDTEAGPVVITVGRGCACGGTRVYEKPVA